MHDPSATAGTSVPAASTASGRSLTLAGGWLSAADEPERARLIEQARQTDAARQLQRCCPRWTRLLEQLTWRALNRLARNQPVDPNEAGSWRSRDGHAEIVLRRHGVTRVSARRLTAIAIQALIDGQARADRDAGIDWTQLTAPASLLDEGLQRAHAALPISLDDPAIYALRDDQRRALCARLELAGEQADDLSRWVLAHPDAFDAADLRCWRIASPTWLRLADEQLPPVTNVDRPVGVFVVPSARAGEGWQLVPVLSLDAIRLIVALGGRLDRDLCSAVLPATATADLLARLNVHTLHAGPMECLDSAGQLAQELSRELGTSVRPGVPRDKRDRWGRLLVARRAHTARDGAERAELALRVITFPARGFTQRRLGAVPRNGAYAQPSAAMDLGEAVQTAIERGLPLLLSTEAAGELKDTVRVGRMKGRPGMLTITTADGVSASTRRVVAEQAIAELRALQRAGANVTLDAGARQVVRMTLARPLADDPVLLGRQREMAALKVVGSGVDASATGTGKTISTGRALAHRASTTRRLRAMVVAEGRLLGQWRDELTRGAPGRGLAPLAPNVEALIVTEQQSVAGQIRAFDRALGDRAGVALVPNGLLDRYPADLQTIPWHLLVADEALRYVNPATAAHQALAQVRFGAAADCWLLTATPRGKSAEHLDVLVGLAVGDRAMIRERLNTREAGDLMDEIHAHRLRVNYGPHLVRVTRQDMQDWMPQVRPAEPLALEPDATLAELLEAIRTGGREAYRRLLAVLRELKRLEPGGELYKQALAELARVQGVVLGNVGLYVDASVDPETLLHSRAALAKALARQGLVHCGDARRRRRAAVAARHHRADDRRHRRRGAGDRVRRTRPLPAPARPHLARAPWRRGARRRRVGTARRVRAAQAALRRWRVPGAVPQPGRARGPQPAVRQRARAPRHPVAADRARAARRPGRQTGRAARLGTDLHPLHQGRRHRARRQRARRPRRRAPPDPRQLRRRQGRRLHRRHPARPDHQPGRRRQARRRLRRHRRAPARRGQRLRRLLTPPARAGRPTPPPNLERRRA